MAKISQQRIVTNAYSMLITDDTVSGLTLGEVTLLASYLKTTDRLYSVTSYPVPCLVSGAHKHEYSITLVNSEEAK